LQGYGAMNYYYFDWQTDPLKRSAVDLERFILQPGYRWNAHTKLNAEIEFEHGGTGVELEFDRFEEFGEFEFDVAKGGEVLLEQMNIEFSTRHKALNFRLGRQKVPFALMFSRDEPTDYLTATVSESEITILPTNWTDNGIGIYGAWGKKGYWKYHFSLLNGLDGSAFNSANWIKRGNQKRFEMANADSWALAVRLDYEWGNEKLAGVSFYGGNTTGNRPKPDLTAATPVLMGEAHVLFEQEPFYVAALAMYGTLGNSEALSNANRNLSNNLNVKRTPVGAAAIASYLELGLEIFHTTLLWGGKHPDAECWLYGRYDYYDSMAKTEGLIFNNPRWERHSWTVGAKYELLKQVQFKLQYTDRTVGAPAASSPNAGTHEHDAVAGFCFEF
ncbi:MAG: autotransporter outer membrane beta-barrel domain-containing protein, partial [Saprospiraceae bacterium]